MAPTAVSQIIEAAGKLLLGMLFAYYAMEIANGGEGYPIYIVAAYAIAGLVSDEELNAEYILPAAFDPRVKDTVARAVKEAAIKSGVARN